MLRIRTVALMGGIAAAVLVAILVFAFNGTKNLNEGAIMPNKLNNTQTTIVDTKSQNKIDTDNRERPVSDESSSVALHNSSRLDIQRIQLVQGSFNIGAGGYATYSSVVPKNAIDVELRGSFASDAKGIKVLIADENAYTLWKDGKRDIAEGIFYDTNEFANSGSVFLSEKGDKWPNAGQMVFLIFDNTGDSSARKQVSATFNLLYST